MIKITVLIDIPDGTYCCGCTQIANIGDFRYCIVFDEPLKNDERFYLKCPQCIHKTDKLKEPKI